MSHKISTPAPVKNRTIYEVNIRQYSKGGTFKEFEKHLPGLKELGVGILWFMPVNPIGIKNRKGTLGSYYSVSNYTTINPEFGNLDEFKDLVGKIHELDMKIIIDWVANHTAWDHIWTKEFPDFYNLDEEGNFKPPIPEWEYVIHLNYNNPALWEEIINCMEFLVKETNIDGFRCDMAHLVPTHFCNLARFRLDKIKPVFMLAESENHDLLECAFDTIYNWKLLHAINDTASGKISVNKLKEIAWNEISYLPDGASLLNFTSNHDENSWNGSSVERLGDFNGLMAALTFVLPGNPLIYSGQEAENAKRLLFFDKDLVEWKDSSMFELYRNLADLKRKNSALGIYDRLRDEFEMFCNEIFSILVVYRRSGDAQIAGIFNFSGEEQKISENILEFVSQKTNKSMQQNSIEPYGHLIISLV
ncbi:MAG: alpha-amylase [Bacteroidales bacterium]|nr:alpha-amylase [Bacteroidales bacterium]